MLALMLQHPRQQPFSGVLHLVALQVERPHPSKAGTDDRPPAARNGEASLLELLALPTDLGQLGVDHHPRPQVVLSIEDGDTTGNTYLVGGKPHTGSVVHGVDHVLGQGPHRRVNVGDGLGLHAQHGIAELGKQVDSLITIPNEKLLTVLGKQVTLPDAFKAANDVLMNAVQGIAELITRPGLINVDFADVRTIMSNRGAALMGTGFGTGDNRAVEAAQEAISSPLLDNISINGAAGVLINITGGMDLNLDEVSTIAGIIQEAAGDEHRNRSRHQEPRPALAAAGSGFAV